MLVELSAALLLVSQSPEAPAPPASTPEETKAEDKIICKKDVVTGSRTQTRRTCMTQREWNKVYQDTRDAVNDHIIRSTAGAPRTGG